MNLILTEREGDFDLFAWTCRGNNKKKERDYDYSKV